MIYMFLLESYIIMNLYEGPQFVTRKITQSVAKIYHGKESHVELGDIDSKRDWGYA